MRTKALANLEAGKLLLEVDQFDASATRLYYALRQVSIYRLEHLGIGPTIVRKDATEWKHDIVCEASFHCRKEAKDAILLRAMRSLRVQADYEEAPVEEIKLKQRLGQVVEYVEAVAHD